MAFTKGFIDSAYRAYKFDKHIRKGKEVFPSRLVTPEEYEAEADRFLGEPLDSQTLEFVRTKRDGTPGDKIRYNKITNELGILANDGTIRSYFIPNPVVHGRPTSLDFYHDICLEVRG